MLLGSRMQPWKTELGVCGKVCERCAEPSLSPAVLKEKIHWHELRCCTYLIVTERECRTELSLLLARPFCSTNKTPTSNNKTGAFTTALHPANIRVAGLSLPEQIMES